MEGRGRTRTVLGAHWGFLAFFVGLGIYHLVTLVMTALRWRCAGAALLAGYLLNLLLVGLDGTDPESGGPLADFARANDNNVLWLALAAVIVVVATPLAEELLIRGALLGQGVVIGWARLRTGRVGASLVAHAADNLPPALPLFT